MNHNIIYPAPLQKGDKVAFISPASAVKDEYVYGAMERFEQRGYSPVLMEYALGHESGSFAASKGDRLIDLLNALEDPEIKAIFCNRGGYGCCQLLPNLSYGLISGNPKWLVGFSDVSALLAAWYRSDVASIHGPMAKHLTTMPEDDHCTQALFSILENGGFFAYEAAPHAFNHFGKASGVLVGGNMAVLNDLASTPYDILDIQTDDDVILFIEDISEPIYKVNRMLHRLALNGTLLRVKGLIFGRFTDYRPDPNFSSMEDMVNDFIKRSLIQTDVPVAFDFPVGHTDENYPLIVGANVNLEVTPQSVLLHNT